MRQFIRVQSSSSPPLSQLSGSAAGLYINTVTSAVCAEWLRIFANSPTVAREQGQRGCKAIKRRARVEVSAAASEAGMVSGAVIALPAAKVYRNSHAKP